MQAPSRMAATVLRSDPQLRMFAQVRLLGGRDLLHDFHHPPDGAGPAVLTVPGKRAGLLTLRLRSPLSRALSPARTRVACCNQVAGQGQVGFDTEVPLMSDDNLFNATTIVGYVTSFVYFVMFVFLVSYQCAVGCGCCLDDTPPPSGSPPPPPFSKTHYTPSEGSMC